MKSIKYIIQMGGVNIIEDIIRSGRKVEKINYQVE